MLAKLRKTEGPAISRPGDQRVGDQLFNAFAYSKNGETYITSWKADAVVESEEALTRSKLRLGVAVGSSCCGFICQFVGFRGLHGSVTLYQLALTLCMAGHRSCPPPVSASRCRPEQTQA